MERLKVADLLHGPALRAESGGPVPAIVVVDLDETDWERSDPIVSALRARRSPLLVGLATAPLPDRSAELLAELTCTLAPAGPGVQWARPESGDLERILTSVATAPLAATTLEGLLRLTSAVDVAEGLLAESLAYSMLLGGTEFARWRSRRPRRPIPEADEPVLLARAEGRLTVTLNRPERHNAFGAAVRDGLVQALELATLDRTVAEVVVRGNGSSFCSGGDLDEFGTAGDLAAAHLLRLQLNAGQAVHRLRDRVRFEVHGACIGAGVEIPSFADRVIAQRDAYFQLPELAMGLVPGAGGTVSLTRRIGRWRTAFMALTNRRFDAPTAREWGLVDDLH
ncbi:MAG: enoyl-CoA hydratase/isomerase family protein [Nocardioides sp.]|uniref:enoyl-CoA hydratase/isomerase family protein n=1 Tax=Nocardioides sp. TaxID=35761 RepID=UPI0039E3CC2C